MDIRVEVLADKANVEELCKLIFELAECGKSYPFCIKENNGWGCTRPKNHTGPCVAGGPETCYAIWGQEK